ncbi:MAG: thioesterase family protein [Tissierellia bacterium]|nr:thioesterase family protein [Tissierellia bacterium]
MEVGIKGVLTKTVDQKESAKNIGSGLLDVFATPALVAFVENTCWMSVSDFIEEGQTTVGTRMDIKHLKATPINMKVTCRSELVKIEGKKLYFEFEASDEKDLIAKGTHERYIVESKPFQEKTDSK